MPAKLRLPARFVWKILRAMNLFSSRKPLAAALAVLCLIGIAGCGGGGGGAKTSSDAGLIAFENINGGISTIKPDGSEERALAFPRLQIVNLSISRRAPALSPDGSRVAFVESALFTLANERTESLIIYRLADSQTMSIPLPGFNAPVARFDAPAWNPDGRSLIFEARDTVSNSGIYRVNADGTGLVRLTANTGRAPEYSRDGRLIVFSLGDSTATSSRLFLMNADGINVRPILNNTGDLPASINGSDPTFAPDNTIFFTFPGDLSDIAQIARVRPDGTGFQKLTNEPNGVSVPSLSPDGRRFVATTSDGAADGRASIVRVFNRDGTNPQTITHNGFATSWSRSR